MERFNLDQLLRYVFAGALAILAVAFAYCEPATWVLTGLAASPTVFLGVVALVGSLIYVVVHRLLLYPVFFRIGLCVFYRDSFPGQRPRNWLKRMGWWLGVLNPLWLGTAQLDIEITRWKRVQQKLSLQQNLIEWSSHVHYLYCAAWAGLVALGVGEHFNWTIRPYRVQVFWIALGFLACALVQHARCLYVERTVANKETDGTLAT